MDTSYFISGTGEPAAVITRTGETQWQARAGDRAVGDGEASRRPDGRIFLSNDSWDEAVFGRIAEAMVSELPRPLYTVVDGVDAELQAAWERTGFVVGRREWEYLVPTDPHDTGLDLAPDLGEVTVLPVGTASEAPLRLAYNEIRAEIDVEPGWDLMPAEIFGCPGGHPALDPARYAVAAGADGYVGLLRFGTRPRHARIEFVAVRADHRRRGIGRALLGEALGALQRSGLERASAYVHADNAAALALFDGVGGSRRAGSNLELVLR
ncbi:GNAT family N-acetyltransferase [Nocardia sp. alder85J]|uniref:GNAT family N-acetyltransferase n=1 Tax=Nocardia sp. alder85J TaxID=2862949 RepID=UPI001CD2F978|nr:GNAT family N-acetyltransferase [Nocardia sp. alder85J]MCX4096120.1 GNAT family N-acetyltransferase [Nocardia sp. alder85J]